MEEEAKRDRISEMPQDIKERIISSLSMKDAVCTSFLSSVWRYSWVSLPFLDFGYDFFCQFTDLFRTLPSSHPKKRHLYSIFNEEEEEDDSESTVNDMVDNFFVFDRYFYESEDEYYEWIDKNAWDIDHLGYVHMLDQLLKVYMKKNQSFRGLKKMSLFVPILSESKTRDYGADIVSRCLSLAKHNVAELYYWFDNIEERSCPKDSYRALRNCLPILDSKTLTKLELRGCYLPKEKKVDLPIDLPKLKHLSLINFNADENMLEKLIAQCRALEKFEFSLSEGSKVLRVPRVSKLKELEVKDIDDLRLVEINALELQSLTLTNLKINKCKVKMASNSCNNLVKLLACSCGITDDFFNNVPEFPHLKTVSLMDCRKLKNIKISGKSLTSLDINWCPDLTQVEVDTLNLSFTGYSSSGKNIIKRIFPKS